MVFPPCHTFIFNTHEEYHNHLPSTSLNTFPSMPPQHFQGVAPIMMLKRSMSFSGIENKYDEVQGDDELSDDGIFQCGEKKRRLNLEQVKALENSFELGNHKLKPERKVQLAKALGLQPRQIAIWFQNRRARWKTKQLEQEYEVLKKQFDAVKADNDVLKIQNKKLQAELQAFNRHTKGSWSNANADTNLDLSSTPVLNSPVSSQLPTSLKSTSITQILHYSSSTDLQNDGFCNILHNNDVQHNFWPWPDQQHHHFR